MKEYLSEFKNIILSTFVNSHHEYFMEETRIGEFDDENGNNIIIVVFSREGSIPHLHFYRGKKVPPKGIGGGCIKLKEPEFFKHGTHQDKLNPRDVKLLVEFLKQPYSKLPKITNWEFVVILWNANNHTWAMPPDSKIPDYLNELR